MEMRAYRESDFEALYAMDCACFTRPFRFTRATLRRVLRTRGAAVVVACEQEVITGFCAAEVRVRVAYVATLDVAPAWRGRGIGRALMQQLEVQAANAGVQEMALHVSVENAGAVRLYEALGYQRLGLETSFYGRGLDAYWYGRVLG